MSIRKILSAVVESSPSDGRLLAYCALLAFIGGGVRAAIRRNDKTTWLDIVLSAAASGIAGFLVGCLCLYAATPIYLALPIVGISGWVGVAILDYASDVAMKVIRQRMEK